MVEARENSGCCGVGGRKWAAYDIPRLRELIPWAGKLLEWWRVAEVDGMAEKSAVSDCHETECRKVRRKALGKGYPVVLICRKTVLGAQRDG